MELSIVIISRNDTAGIERTLKSVVDLEADLLVYDAGCSDDTKQAVIKNGARFQHGGWESYEHIRYKAAQLAKFDWILMLHADEIADELLNDSIQHIDFTDHKKVYRIHFKNYFGKRCLRYGESGRYSHIRLANRKGIQISDGKVQEKLFCQPGIEICNLQGYILHRAVKDCNAFSNKLMNDALFAAVKYHRQGKKASLFKLFFSPIFSFCKNYFFKLGFLDGWEGYVIAKMGAWYTFLKYTRLRELNQPIKIPL